MIVRLLLPKLLQNISKQKVTLLLGARRVGKTELLRELMEQTKVKTLWLNGEDADAAALLENRSIANYRRLLKGCSLLIIDEAQFIPDMGRKAKLMIDEIKPLHIILTGSSAFDISQQAGEPLVGRSITHQLYPLSQEEVSAGESPLQTAQALPERLVWGSYPELFSLTGDEEKAAYLKELVNTYLLKDVLSFEAIRNPQKMLDLLRMIALQVGSEVSLEELGRGLQLSKNTVERYLDLLTKVFILYKRTGYSNNLRKEITKSSHWYFYDVGIRNAVIGDFRPLPLRKDVGLLWESYILAERLKHNDYTGKLPNSYFWRTYDQQEIDLIEESAGGLTAFEIKWKAQNTKVPVAFAKAYPDAVFEEISRTGYLAFVGG